MSASLRAVLSGRGPSVEEFSMPTSDHRSPFASFFMGGFDCATQRRRDGARVDSLVAQAHDRFVALDYAAIARHGLRTARDGLRWHLIEGHRGTYDWSSWTPMLRAAEEAGVQVIWDLWH